MRLLPNSVLLSSIIAVVGVTGAGCSSESSPAEASAPGDFAQSAHALVVNVDRLEPLRFGPASVIAAEQSRTALLLTRAAAQCGIGNTKMKAESTGAVFPPSGRTLRVSTSRSAVFAPFESSGGPSVPATCDERLEQVGALVCMADQFAQIGDAVGSLRWEETLTTFAIAGLSPELVKTGDIPWTIAPQSQRDRFIARDLALALLATAAKLEATPMVLAPGSAGSQTVALSCGEIYAAIDKGQAPANMLDYNSGDVFGLAGLAFDEAWQLGNMGAGYIRVAQGAWDSRKREPSAAHTVARSRIVHNIKLLQTVGELTKRLVETSVEADMAGAAAQAARASDTRVASRLRWGEADLYDSLAHVGRTLSGRLEVSGGSLPILGGDRACQGVPVDELTKRAYAGGLDARIEDPSIASEAQLRAVGLAAQLGVAVDRAALETIPTADLRAIFFDQLVSAQVARTNSTTPGQIAAIVGGGQALAWKASLATLTAPDLLVGLEHTWATARMRLGVPRTGSLGAAAKEAGVYRAAGEGEPLVRKSRNAATPLADHVLARSSLSRDTFSRTAALNAASMCLEPAGVAQAFGASAPGRADADRVAWQLADGDRVPRWAAQDPFSLAQFLERRVTILGARVAAPSGGETDAKAEAGRVATGLRAWAGPARLFVSSAKPASWTERNASPDDEQITVEIQGAAPSELGFEAAEVSGANAAAMSRLSLVVGSPYVAECALGGVGPCPNLPANSAPIAANMFEYARDDGSGALAATRGVYEVLRWRFSGDALRTALGLASRAGAALAAGGSAEVQLYVIGPDPTKNGARGILGIIGMPQSDPTPTSAVVNPVFADRRFVVSLPIAAMQRAALDRTMSLPPTSTNPQVSPTTAGAAAMSCVEGQASLFVPLENEMIQGLAPGEDSWRYWLERAERLAAEADQRANELLTQRLSVENRKENAAARLSSICGTTAAVSRLSVQNNQVVTSGDSALDACLSSRTIDVFTFGQMPADNAAKQAVFDRVVSDVDCAPPGDQTESALCKRLRAGTASQASAGMSFSRLAAQKKTPACGEPTTSFLIPGSGPQVGRQPRVLTMPRKLSLAEVLATAGSRSGLDTWTWLRDGRAVGYAGLDVLSGLQRAQLAQGNDAKWTVSVAGAVRLASDVARAPDAQPWPGCLRWGNCNPTNDPTTQFAIDALNASFRRCSRGASWTLAGSSLRECEGLLGTPGAIGEDDWRAFANDVLWRVEGGLWLGQMMAGGVRAGAFNVPVPIAVAMASSQPIPPVGVRSPWMNNFDFALAKDHLDFATVSGAIALKNPYTSTYALRGGAVGSAGAPVSRAFHLRSARTIGTRELWPARMRKVYPSGSPDDAPLANDLFLERFVHVPGVNQDYRATVSNVRRGATGGQVVEPGAFDEPNYEVFLATKKFLSPINQYNNDSERIGWIKLGGEAPRVGQADSVNGVIAWWDWGTTWSRDSYAGANSTSTFYRRSQHSSGFNFYFTGDDYSRELFAYHRPALFARPDTDIASWTGNANDPWSAWPKVLTELSANARVRAFVNSTPAFSVEERFREFAGAHALACAISSTAMYDDGAMPAPPQLSGSVDAGLNAMSAFSAKLARRVDESLGDLYIVNVPSLVATRQDSNPTGGAGMILEAATAFRSELIGTREAAAEMNDTTWELTNAIELARVDFQLQNNRGEQRSTELHLRKLRVVEDQLLAPLEALRDIAKVGAGTTWYNPSSWFANPVQVGAILAITATRMAYNQMEIDGLDDLSSLTQAEIQLESTKALKTLYTTAKISANKLRAQLASLRQHQLAAQQNLAKYQSLQAEAREAAAIASGAREVIDENGQARPIPLNVVNDRLEEGNYRRYQQALVRAKQAAFYARRAFEQKIGMPMTAIFGKVSGYDAPSNWIDSVCRTTGMNYKDFRSQSDPDGGLSQNDWDKAQVGAYADSWIGDYLSKFRSYTEALLVQYPFTSGDDVALLSMRTQLLGTARGCTEPTRNRVTYSGSLDRIGAAVTNEPFRPVIGWQVHPCSSGALGCLQAKNSALVNLPAMGDAGASVQRDDVTWIQELSNTTTVVALDGGVADAGVRDGGVRDGGVVDAGTTPAVDAGGAISGTYGATPGVAADWPKGWISQATALAVGHYRVTFKDLALDAAGNPASSGVPFAVAVFGVDSWGSAAVSPQSFTPSIAWTDRAVHFTLSSPGAVRVAFRASVEGSLQLGSVALANVQIERLDASSSNAAAVVYQRTQGSLTVPINYCNPQDSQRFRELFTHDCERDGRCYWELATPFRIPVSLLSKADLDEGTPGRKRYNHRLGQMALNVVGSGVRDCTGVDDYGTCASAQTLDYTLEHDGTGAELWGLDSPVFRAGPYPFDFGLASLSGRAVAAERNFTYLSSSDRAMAFGSGVGKNDFDGRPIDARTLYRLRIWETDALRWDRVDDVQMLLTYRYWTKLAANGYGQ